MNEIKKCIFDILDENGIYIDSNEMEEDLDLREYILDSLQYVYIIVELEDRLGLELPDEVLLYENLASINGFANMISDRQQEMMHIGCGYENACEGNDITIDFQTNTINMGGQEF